MPWCPHVTQTPCSAILARIQPIVLLALEAADGGWWARTGEPGVARATTGTLQGLTAQKQQFQWGWEGGI